MIGYVTANDDLIYFLSYLISNIPTYYDKKMSIFYVICMTKKRTEFSTGIESNFTWCQSYIYQSCKIVFAFLTWLVFFVKSQVKSSQKMKNRSQVQVKSSIITKFSLASQSQVASHLKLFKSSQTKSKMTWLDFDLSHF